MTKEQLRAWVLAVLSEGITPLQWAKASGFKNDNQLRNFLSRPKAGMQHETVAKLQAGLRVLKGLPSPETAPTASLGVNQAKSPVQEARDVETRILALCADLSEDAKLRVDVARLAKDIAEILGHMPEQPKKSLKKTG
jgi:hypothetical protein